MKLDLKIRNVISQTQYNVKLRQSSLNRIRIKLNMIVLISILLAGLVTPWAVRGNPIPYPATPSTELPDLTVQNPDAASPLYANNTLELHFNVTKPQSWNSYYHNAAPLVGVAWVYLYLDGVINQTYPAKYDTLDQYTTVLANLPQQQHTVWIDVYCLLYSQLGFSNASVSQTLTFTINAQAQTIAFHKDPVVTTRPGTQSTVAPSPPPPTATPTTTPPPNVPEFISLTIPLLLLIIMLTTAGLLVHHKSHKH